MMKDNINIYIHNNYINHMRNMNCGNKQYKNLCMIYIQNMKININMIG
jgi:hypothetical protein